MAPSVAQLETAVVDPIQVTKDALKTQGDVEDVEDQVRNFIYFDFYELTLRP